MKWGVPADSLRFGDGSSRPQTNKYGAAPRGSGRGPREAAATNKYALFIGCTIPARVPEYERSARAVLSRLGVELVDLDFVCCGYRARHESHEAHLLLAAGNLALAARRDLDILALCQCCYGSLRHAQHLLSRTTRTDTASPTSTASKPNVRHLLEVLARGVGVDTIAARVSATVADDATASIKNLGVAAHYGCHALRPSDVVDLDNPHAPTVFERLIAATGARPVDWPRRLDCCGAPLEHTNPTLAARIREGKLADAIESGAHCLCTACPYCQSHFAEEASRAGLRTLLYPQLLGLALGLSPKVLGLPP